MLGVHNRVQSCTSACSSTYFGFAISDSHLSGKGSKEFWLLGMEFGSRLVSLSQGIGGDFACLCADEVNVAFENCNE